MQFQRCWKAYVTDRESSKLYHCAKFRITVEMITFLVASVTSSSVWSSESFYIIDDRVRLKRVNKHTAGFSREIFNMADQVSMKT